MSDQIKDLLKQPILQKCCIESCDKPVRFYVVLQMRVHKNHPPARSTPIRCLCEDHDNATWEQVITDHEWKKISEMFEGVGRAAPVKQHSYMELIDIKQPYRF